MAFGHANCSAGDTRLKALNPEAYNMDKQLKVLCVDDNADAANTTAMILRQAGFNALACHGGIEAVAVAEEFRPDVCLIDLAMPDMAGDELAARLAKREGAPPRLIALTGHWDITSQHKTHNAGFERHLVKPVEPDALIAAVRGPLAKDAAPAPG
jgi:two-component system, OmpR family, response regulator